jgi:hypothetical protein
MSHRMVPRAGEARGALVGLWERLAADSSQWVVSAALASLGPLLALLPRSCITDGARARYSHRLHGPPPARCHPHARH